MAQGALEAFEAKMRHDVTAREGNKLAEMQSIQIRLGEAAAEVWAARSTTKQDCQEIFHRARRNEMPTMDERIRYRRDQAYVAKLSVRAINRLFEVSGGRSLFGSSAIQRFHRDAHEMPTLHSITSDLPGTLWPSSTGESVWDFRQIFHRRVCQRRLKLD
jgi:3-hydroxy-9,10-secoandrosta-1,3,5(10)-triene-9,17-dione monooxygenase